MNRTDRQKPCEDPDQLEALVNDPSVSLEMKHYLRKLPEGVEELTAKEVAVVLGYGKPEMIYHLAEEGKIGYLARGRSRHRMYLFPRVSVIKYIRDNCNR